MRADFRGFRRSAPPESALRALGLTTRVPAEVSSQPPLSSAATSSSVPSSGAILRWLTDISGWEPSKDEWQLLLGTLPEEESTKVMKYRFPADQKRALVSRLLQRRACVEATGVKWSDVQIRRTKGSKPYMANKPANGAGGAHNLSSAGPNWNFNVSHEGKFVVLAAEPLMVVGVDVAAPEEERGRGRSKRGIDEQLRFMKDQLSLAELAAIEAARPDEQRMEDVFRKFWSLKEAFTKGRGDGLGCEFKRCDFSLHSVVHSRDEGSSVVADGVQLASVTFDGRPKPAWGFYIQPLEASHWVSVARGPPCDVVDAHGGFKATFTVPTPPMATQKAHLARAERPFEPKRIVDLLPDELRDQYATLAAARQ